MVKRAEMESYVAEMLAAQSLHLGRRLQEAKDFTTDLDAKTLVVGAKAEQLKGEVDNASRRVADSVCDTNKVKADILTHFCSVQVYILTEFDKRQAELDILVKQRKVAFNDIDVCRHRGRLRCADGQRRDPYIEGTHRALGERF